MTFALSRGSVEIILPMSLAPMSGLSIAEIIEWATEVFELLFFIWLIDLRSSVGILYLISPSFGLLFLLVHGHIRLRYQLRESVRRQSGGVVAEAGANLDDLVVELDLQ